MTSGGRYSLGAAGMRAWAWLVALAAALCLLTPAGAQAPTVPEAIASAVPGVRPAPASSPQAANPAAQFEKDAAEAASVLRKAPSRFDYNEVQELNRLRDRLAADRDLSREKADRSNLEARIIQAQINALGPLPETGKTEASAITEQRKALDAKLSLALAPVLRAREAQARAATLVTDLDARISAIDRLRKGERARSVLDPRLWIDFAADAAKGMATVAHSVSAAYAKEGFGGLIGRLLGAAALVLLGPIACTWALRAASRKIEQRIPATRPLSSRLSIAILEDVTGAIVLFFGIGCTIGAFLLVMKPFLALNALITLSVLLVFSALSVAIAHWLGRSTLRSPFPELRLVELRPELVDKGVSTVRWIGIVMALEAVVEGLEQGGFASATVIDLTSALLLIWGGWLIWTLANLLQRGRVKEEEEHERHRHERLDFAAPFSRILKLLVIGSVCAAIVGYIVLAREIFSDVVATIAIIAIAIFLHRLIATILDLLAQNRFRRYRRVLHIVPMVTGLLLTLGTLPLLAITWGYNSREIGDALVALRSGVTIGRVNLSAGDVLTFGLVFLGGYAITRWLKRILTITVLPQFGLDKGSQASIVTMIGYLGIVLAAVLAIASTGLDLSSLTFVAGALSVGLGFGLQSTVENFTSGVILLVERPIREGDWIEVGEFSGIVRKVSVRSTHLESFDRHQIIIPNSQLITGSVKNLSLGAALARVVVPVGVAYGSDLENVRKVLLEIAGAHAGVLPSPAPAVTLDTFADSTINLRLLLFVPDATDGATIASQIRFTIAARFAEEDIQMPFPQREIRILKD
ncbi:MAG: hypothetical protein DI555_20470 [Novosphingobium pentaromativorans]|uniref:DUF3772 domain-containing protein n=2 Tax=Novosphingobium TaxID=165696 RepID=A0A2W5NMC3_9SPHN|nr:MAG: hypothetical protein DI555_20470 [Novosphingobium pentaromativorans]